MGNLFENYLKIRKNTINSKKHTVIEKKNKRKLLHYSNQNDSKCIYVCIIRFVISFVFIKCILKIK